MTATMPSPLATPGPAPGPASTPDVVLGVDPGTRPGDLARPGHVFPQRYREGGVLRRAGRGEAAVDLARLAGRRPAAVMAELVDDDGSLPTRAGIERSAARHDLPVVTITALIEHRRRREELVRQVSAARVPTPYGDFTAVVSASLLDGTERVALVRGDARLADRATGRPTGVSRPGVRTRRGWCA